MRWQVLPHPSVTMAVTPPRPASLAVSFVRALMERHGLPKYRQSAWLADAMGLSYSQAHRRMTGASPWSLEDLAKVAALFGEACRAGSAGQPQTSVPAVMDVGGARLRVSCGSAILSISRAPITGRGQDIVRVVGGAGERGEGRLAYRIERLEARPVAPLARSSPCSTTTRTSQLHRRPFRGERL